MQALANFYERIRLQVRLSEIIRERVNLTRKGKEYSGLCPFHSEKTPSFTVNDLKKFYYCFGCNATGDVIRFVAETSGLNYHQAAVKIAESNSIEIPKITARQAKINEEADNIYQILNLANDFFLAQNNAEVVKYLEMRGINEETRKKFTIGYAPGGEALQHFFTEKAIPLPDLVKAGILGKDENGRIYSIFNKRIMFPIKNSYNKIVGFGGRVLNDGLPKYINSPETIVFKKSETMYGEDSATNAFYKKNYAIIVEGYLDVIALHQVGFTETVACLGTAVNEKHLHKLWHLCEEIIICLDGDAAGIRAGNRVINIALPYLTSDRMVSFIKLPAQCDPDDIIKQGGKELFTRLLEKRISLSEMVWLNEYQGNDFSTAEAKSRLEQKLAEYCKQIKDRSLAINISRYFKNQVWHNLVQQNNSRNNSRNNSYKAKAAQLSYVPTGQNYNYTYLEFLENSLAAYMINFPELTAENEEIKSFFNDLDFTQTSLNLFKEWFLEQINKKLSLKITINYGIIEESAKNAGFHEDFLVLSKFGNQFLEFTSISGNTTKQILLFQWMKKKYYLVSLQQEYDNLNDTTDKTLEKALFYLKEIQKISAEINKLNELFTN